MLMVNKKSGGNKVPTWMVTFSDLMTLLLTFFILLLSYSQTDEKKYKQASDSIIKAFNQGKLISTEGGGDAAIILPLPAKKTQPQKESQTDQGEKKKIRDLLDKWVNKIEKLLAKEIDKKLFTVKKIDSGVLISVKEHAAFSSGSEKLQPSFVAHLRKISSLFPDGKVTIVVAGHTDNKPIVAGHELFRSNWDLSTLRATSVVHKLLEISSIPAANITAQGHADTKPVALNTTKKGRSLNRRVEILLHPVLDEVTDSELSPPQEKNVNGTE
ncbi:MAG: OmpA family protein [Gammaproteobacteria bacterium]|nr:OmpA family protein [Gammaproteobacteria bacterium]